MSDEEDMADRIRQMKEKLRQQMDHFNDKSEQEFTESAETPTHMRVGSFGKKPITMNELNQTPAIDQKKDRKVPGKIHK